jgi:hypothetical protein
MSNKNGYWVVSDRIFYSKPLAIEYASRTNAQIHFNFFNEFYDKINWEVEPKQSLKELYRDRAEQILSKYDYVVLLLSGGSDSTNMVKTFLNNGLRPNEVISYGILNKVINKKSNTNIEITLSASKTAKLCYEAGIPYRFINLWDNVKNIVYDDRFFEIADCRMCIDSLLKIEGLHYDQKFLDITKNGKKLCLVSGLEKPRVFIQDGFFQTGYLDNIVSPNFWGKDINDIHLERFYTTTDMVEINIKQCHVIVDYFEKNILDYKNILTHKSYFDKQKYYNIINNIIYPDTWNNENYFSLGKNKSALNCQKYNFIGNVMPNFDLFKKHSGLITDFYKSINYEKYIDNSTGDLVGFFSNKFYKIKKIKENTN